MQNFSSLAVREVAEKFLVVGGVEEWGGCNTWLLSQTPTLLALKLR